MNRFLYLIGEFFLNPFLLLIKYRYFIFITTLKDLKTNFAGFALGAAWIAIAPLILLIAYSGVYLYIFKVRVEGLTSIEYVIFIFSGLVPYLGFVNSLMLGIPSILSNIHLIKHIMIPMELIPVKSVLIAIPGQLIGFFILFLFLLLTSNLSIYFLLLFVMLLLQTLFSIGIVWILSSLNVYFRDIQQIIPISLMVFMMLSPISFSEAQAPENIRFYLELNPLYHMIVCYHYILIYGSMPPFKVLSIFTIESVGFFTIGFAFIQKMKLLLVDHV